MDLRHRRPIALDGGSLTLEDVAAVARGGAPVELALAAAERIAACRRVHDELVERGVPIYGVTTGVGDSVEVQVDPRRGAAMQSYLVRKCGCGSGPTLPEDQARAAVLVRANCLARGSSAVRPVVVERLLDLLNERLTPRIPEQGSVGASGDLVPGSYIAAALMGERRLTHDGAELDAAEAWRRLGKEPLRLASKEGLALLNGTMVMAGIAALATLDAERLAGVADVATALTCEALATVDGPFHPFLFDAKPHPGCRRSAAHVRALLAGSGLTRSYGDTVADLGSWTEGCRRLPERLQASYSVRCAPHVIGVLYDAVEWIRRWLTVEINSANDNPIYDAERGEVHSGGNFSGFHVGLAMDSLKTAVASVADLLDRQLALLVDARFSQGLPANLVAERGADDPERGIFHGFKAVQLAVSALAAEALQRTMPMTAFSRSTECHNQDKVSMATIAARQARDVVELTERCAAMHLLAACQAVELRGASHLGRTRQVYDKVRAVSPLVDRDRELDADLDAVVGLLRSGELVAEMAP